MKMRKKRVKKNRNFQSCVKKQRTSAYEINKTKNESRGCGNLFYIQIKLLKIYRFVFPGSCFPPPLAGRPEFLKKGLNVSNK